MPTLPRPADSQPLAKVYEHQRALASQIEGALQAGVVSIPSGTGSFSVPIQLPIAIQNNSYAITLTPTSGRVEALNVTARSASGFSLNGNRNSAGTYSVYWQVVAI